MNNILVLILLFVLLTSSSCAREKPTTELVPAPTPFVPAPSTNISIVGGGPSETIILSDQERLFKNSVLNADLIVSGNITGLRYEVVTVVPPRPVGNNVTGTLRAYSDNATPIRVPYTIFTLTVDKVIKGDPVTKPVLIKVQGGYIGESYLVPTGYYFRISDRVLVSLQREEDNIYTVSRLAWLRGSTIRADAELDDVIVRVLKVMIANNIPIALPMSEWPPFIEIAPPVQRPEKKTIPVPEQDKKTP